jgi:hypothetical protein
MSELQQSLLDRIHAFLEARPEGPTTQEVQTDFRFRFRFEGSVERALEGLAAAGHLVRRNERWQLKQPDVQLHFQLGGNETRPAGLPKR